jgi:signal transduction histidine kinase
MAVPLTTMFAPAERSSLQSVREQARYFTDIPLISTFLDAVPNFFMVLNRHRQTVFANRTLLDVVGGDTSLVEGLRPGEILGCVHADENQPGCGTTEFCRTCGATRAILSSLNGERSVDECRIIRANGDALDLRVWATPLELGGETFSIFTMQDISDEKRRQALERIFFHDILNIAGTVLGYAEIIDDPRHADSTVRISNIIYHASIRLVDEIKNQQALLAAENGDLAVRPAMLNSLKVLRNIRRFYQGHQVAQDCHVELASDAQDVAFVSDQMLLERVLGNMTKNALEACGPGQTVTLSCGIEDEQVWFSAHNPTYMPRDVQLQVFQRSFSTKGDGRGLGTYSIKLLTERYLNGSVGFVSSLEQGTIFRVTYPMASA